MLAYQSWNRYPSVRQKADILHWATDVLPDIQQGETLLPYGLGRSYGDVCLNQGGRILDTQNLNHFLHFDRAKGILRCESGVTLAQILSLIIPVGWFLPVTPGTQFITLGGAVANDVHGKNHHCAGNFGHHIRQFELLRSDGSVYLCSPQQNPEWFRATVGGLGLTGLIRWVEFQLIPINNPLIEVETVKFANIDEFFSLSKASAFDYSVAWLDGMAKGKSLGRGLFMQGNHAAPQWNHGYCMKNTRKLSIPIDFPGFTLNKLSIKLFNTLYYHKQIKKVSTGLAHYLPFFYPLDGVENWNRIYGAKGFFQYQCVLPYDNPAVIKEMLKTIANSGQASFLGVMKVFGDIQSLGLLSFPRKGFTLALDFRNHGEKTLRLLEALDVMVSANGGVVYPAKDTRMSAQHFQQFYPNWEDMLKFIDPHFSSGFWRRVTK
ncbi:FAD-binding oxidoreductase [Candidatus Venteria ishoeyi]|uniref:FAD-binding oxidoreductase n=1 Tax=Candidatus Venteria ishoeyi TaxID=1899563 RepID=UPI0025A67D23|nr:FAD-binding oxidoreductase [Candidatus Venteria ishoeyi]MDM8548360.1 FAD-binding oxidoreductase [Candidatus Venteria ishoeyi]